MRLTVWLELALIRGLEHLGRGGWRGSLLLSIADLIGQLLPCEAQLCKALLEVVQCCLSLAFLSCLRLMGAASPEHLLTHSTEFHLRCVMLSTRVLLVGCLTLSDATALT